MPRPRRGFSFVEALMSMAVMAILITLLVPALQQSREAARRTTCKNNLAQLALALQNYEMAFGMLPPGTVNASGPIVNAASPDAYHLSWTVRILPYIELGNVYRRFDFHAGAYDPVNLLPQQRPLELLLCPSDGSFAGTADGRFASNYVGIHNSIVAPIDVDNDGLLYLNSSVRYAEIFDGSSNTAILAEKMRPAEVWGWASGTRDTLRNSGLLKSGMMYGLVGNKDPIANRLREKVISGLPEDATPVLMLPGGGLGSQHSGGFQCALADGSVRFVTGLSPALCGRGDGGMPFDY